MNVGYFAMGIVSAFHAGLLGDAKHELSQKEIEKIAAATAAANAAQNKEEKDKL